MPRNRVLLQTACSLPLPNNVLGPELDGPLAELSIGAPLVLQPARSRNPRV